MASGVRAFAERGFHATTTRDIALGAGVSPAALYVYFPSKVALLCAIGRAGHEQALALVAAAIDRGTDPVSRIRWVVTDFVAWHAERHAIARVVQYELGALPAAEQAAVTEPRRRIERLVRDVIADGVRTGVFDVPDVRLAATAALSLGVDVARWYRAETSIDPAELGARYARMILRMLGTKPED